MKRMHVALMALAASLAACGKKDEAPTMSATTMALFAAEPVEEAGLRNPASFANIADTEERSAALYQEMFKVISHPRCMNCHPRGDIPYQGDDMRLHVPPVERGPEDSGIVGMECSTCHGSANFAYVGAEGSIPGHDPWHLAPASMGWVGLTPTEICNQIKDPMRNGGKSLEELHAHNAEDGLVGWGWEPGDGRTPAPGTQEIFGQLTRAWIDTGAACPAG